MVLSKPINTNRPHQISHTYISDIVLNFHSLRTGNLVPRVLRLFGQRVGARRDSGDFENSNLATNRWPKSLRTLGRRLAHRRMREDDALACLPSSRSVLFFASCVFSMQARSVRLFTQTLRNVFHFRSHRGLYTTTTTPHSCLDRV